MTTKTTDLWLSRDPDGSYWVSEKEMVKSFNGDGWVWVNEDGPICEWHLTRALPTIRKGTKRRIRVTVEVLR